MSNSKLTTITDPRSAAAEAYRTLRTNLTFNNSNHALTTLLVTSSKDGADKSLVVANLAATFAQGGTKTILVDADLYKPSQHEIWGVANERGLTTMMNDDAAIANPPLVATNIANLSILPSGTLPAVPADLLSSPRISEIIGVLKARASIILFDAPPVLAATDAALLGARLDGALLVVRSGQTRRDEALRARQALERVKVDILGAVLTNAPKESGAQYR